LDSDEEDDFVKQMVMDKENIDPNPKQRKSKRLSKRVMRKQSKEDLKKRDGNQSKINHTTVDDFEYSIENETHTLTPNLVLQPSSNTSLSAAKAYFDQLDSKHVLKVSSEMSSPRISHPCVRTMRKIDYNCPQLLKDYDEYCKTSQECNLSPLSLKRYTTWRNQSIFPIGGNSKQMRICDGMLDE